MSKLSKRLPADNKKLQPLVGEISWSENLIPYCDLPKVQPLVAQIGWSHNPIILQRCKEKNRTVVEYALHDARKPIGVSTYRMVKRLPRELKGQLPSPAEIAKLLEGVE